MVSLDRFELFCAVVQTGSFTGAAARLEQTRAAVSFSIKQLEAELGVTLLTRTTRRIALTDAGERFYGHCLEVVHAAQVAIDEARAEHSGLQGSLRITSTVEYGLRVLAPALHGFCQQHPQLQVQLQTHTAQADLVRDGFDVAIRLGQVQDSSYRGVCLDSYALCLVMAPALLAPGQDGLDNLERVGQLPQLRHSRFQQHDSWPVEDARGHPGQYQGRGPAAMVADNASVLRTFALQGMGVALLPLWLVDADLASGALIDALPGYRFARQSVYALYPDTRHVPRKVRAWIDYLKAYLQDPVRARPGA
ncbi:HTH-type transcriptional regulator DmlR [compost metagenome]